MRAWIKAARLPSQSYIAMPLLLGQAWAVEEHRAFALPTLLLVHLFGLFDQLYIVFLNDYADQETDRINRTSTIFSGGSRVLIDGELRPNHLLLAGRLSGAGMVAATIALVGRGAPALLLGLMGVALFLLWAYSFPPLRLSYRGGGELLQTVGMGLVLPLYGFVGQAGTLMGMPWLTLLALVPAQWGGAIATALPDEPSDRASEKRTVAVQIGGRSAGCLVVALQAVSLVAAFFLHPLPAGPRTAWLAVPALAIVAQTALGPTPPGGLGVSARVFLAILANLGLLVAFLAPPLLGLLG